MIRRRDAALAALALLVGCAAPETRTGEGHVSAAHAQPLAPPTSLDPGSVRIVPRLVIPPDETVPAPTVTGKTAATSGIVPGPPFAALGATGPEAEAALAAFARSCGELLRRSDRSGLTRNADWQPACAAASGWRRDDALGFFARYFEAARIGDGQSYATGYYEPEIRGALHCRPGYEVPVYRRPPDLVDVDLGQFAPDLAGRSIRGKVQDGKLGLYPDRAAIVGGALAGQGLEIAWAADPIEFFFLQVQGSGLLRLPDGGIVRIGYDTQNGRDYTGIGRWMKDQGLFAPGQSASMQGIMARLRQEPDGGAAIMDRNRSFVFFRLLGGPGPIGAMGLPVAGRVTVAADPAFVPLGAPVFLSLDRGEASGLWVAQDTGGAIKGANRFDTYWGSGDEARSIAGGMSGRGRAWVLLPIGTVARLNGGAAGGEAGDAGTAPRP